MGAVYWVLGGVMKLCAFMFGLGVLALALGAANELFGLGIFNDDYPVVDFGGGPDGSSQTIPGTFGEYVAQTGLITLGAGILGSILFYFVGDPDEYEEYGYSDPDTDEYDTEFRCPECGKTFVARSAVDQHYGDVHT